MKKIPKLKPHKLVQEVIIHDIEKEARRRANNYQGKRNRGINIESTPGRRIGTQDWTDIPADVPWQKTYLDQTGIAFPVNENWVCPRCKRLYLSSYPPAICSCGMPSPIQDKKIVRFNR